MILNFILLALFGLVQGKKSMVPESCPSILKHLANRYVLPHESHGGITVDKVDDALFKIETMIDSMILVQVLNNTIYTDTGRLNMVNWDMQRFNNFIDHLKDFIQLRASYCSRLKSTTMIRECERDFELVLDVKDCQSNWATPSSFNYPGRGVEESMARYDSLPIFTITKCKNRPNLPIVQWFEDRDGPFTKWDDWCHDFRKKATVERPEDRVQKAIFRGGFQPMSTFNEEGKVSTCITNANWRFYGRSRLAMEGMANPHLIDAGLHVYGNHRDIFGSDIDFITRNDHFVSAVDQARNFAYVVYSEGACGWADRLKTLLLYNSTIFLQETSCWEYYQDLMIPYKHYVPVKGNFADLKEKVEWAKKNPVLAAEIGQNALKLREELLTVDSMKCYMNYLLERYVDLVQYRPFHRESAKPIWTLTKV